MDSDEKPVPSTPVAIEYARPGVAWEETLDVKAALVMICAKTNPGAGPPCSSGSAAS